MWYVSIGYMPASGVFETRRVCVLMITIEIALFTL